VADLVGIGVVSRVLLVLVCWIIYGDGLVGGGDLRKRDRLKTSKVRFFALIRKKESLELRSFSRY